MPDKTTPSFKNSNTGGLSVSFFQYLIEKVEDLVGEKVVRQFEEVKSRRDRYLREEWTSATRESDAPYFREIDYEYLITLLGNRFEDDKDQLYTLYVEITRSCVQFGELKKAQDLLRVLGDDFQFGDPKKRLIYFMLKGKWAFYARELDKASACYAEALELFTEENDSVGIIKALNNLGIITIEQWETDKGKQYFRQANELIKNGDTETPSGSEIFVKMNLGILAGMQGDYLAAIDQFEDLEAAFPDLDGISKLKVLLNKGVALKDAGELKKARNILGQAVNRAQELPEYHAYGDAALDLAEVYIRTGDFSKGQHYLAEGFKVFAQMHNRANLAEAYRIFGILYREQGEFELAESQFEISTRIGIETGNLLCLTETYFEYSKWAKMNDAPARHKEYLEKSLSYARKMHGTQRVERLEGALKELN
mgnify:CR=1 FL=1